MPISKTTENKSLMAIAKLMEWKIELDEEWSNEELSRIHGIFSRLIDITGESTPLTFFNNQSTSIHHSNRKGTVGRTKGSQIYLDEQWTDWTLAHELGHRWNNAWGRKPQSQLQRWMGSGKSEQIKRFLRRLERSIERFLNRLGINKRLDWLRLWYSAGIAPPPCGIDRNFNASEDLAESFAAVILPHEARQRAKNAASRLSLFVRNWNWGAFYEDFKQTPRGKAVVEMFTKLPIPEKHTEQANQTSPQN